VRSAPYAGGRTVVVVNPAPEDCTCLKDSLDDLGLQTHCVSDNHELEEFLRTREASVVLCEAEDHSWKNVLDKLAEKDGPPRLIVMSRLADERLWAEVLNLGGYDVLAKPLDSEELRRVVATAAGMTAIPQVGGLHHRCECPAA